jgi:hypothetical protein
MSKRFSCSGSQREKISSTTVHSFASKYAIFLVILLHFIILLYYRVSDNKCVVYSIQVQYSIYNSNDMYNKENFSDGYVAREQNRDVKTLQRKICQRF